jgi:hypothetical protein
MATIMERMKASAKAQLEGGGSTMYNKAWKAKKGTPTLKIAITPPDGQRTNIRVVPYVVTNPRNNPDCEEIGAQWYKRRYWQHRVGPTGQEIRVPCLMGNFGKPCPVCALVSKLRAEGVDDKVLRALSKKERELFNVYDHNDKTMKIVDVSTHYFGKILLKEVNDPENVKDGSENFVNPGVGGTMLSCRFDNGDIGKSVKLGSVKFVKANAIPKEILDKAEDLDAILTDMSTEEIQRIMDGVIGKATEAEGSADFEAPPAAPAAAPVTAPVAEPAKAKPKASKAEPAPAATAAAADAADDLDF